MRCGIYRIKNIYNGKFYIGASSNVDTRLKQHKYFLEQNKHHCKELQNAWKEYTPYSFLFEVVEIVNKEENLNKREQLYIDIYNKDILYNSTYTSTLSKGVKYGDVCKLFEEKEYLKDREWIKNKCDTYCTNNKDYFSFHMTLLSKCLKISMPILLKCIEKSLTINGVKETNYLFRFRKNYEYNKFLKKDTNLKKFKPIKTSIIYSTSLIQSCKGKKFKHLENIEDILSK